MNDPAWTLARAVALALGVAICGGAAGGGCDGGGTDAGPEGPVVVEGVACDAAGTIDACTGNELVNCWAATGQGVRFDCASWCTGMGTGFTGGECVAQTGDDACSCSGETPVVEGEACTDPGTADACIGAELLWCDAGLGRRGDCFVRCTELELDSGPCQEADGDDACACVGPPAVANATVCNAAASVDACASATELVVCLGNVGVTQDCVASCVAMGMGFTSGSCVAQVGDDECACSM